MTVSILHILSFSLIDATELTAYQIRVICAQPFAHLTVWRLDESIGIDLSIRGQVADQTDIWAFRRLNWADTTIVRAMHVAHIETRLFTRETTGAKRRETAFMTNLRESIRLIHKLGELAATEKLLYCRYDRANSDERTGACPSRLLDAHTLLHDTLHTQHAHTQPCLDQLAYTAHTPIAQVIDIVFMSMTVVQLNQAANNAHQVIQRQGAVTLWNRQVQLPIQCVTTHTPQIVASSVEEHVPHKRTGIIDGGGVARTYLSIEFEQGLIFAFDGIAVERCLDIAHVGIGIHVTKEIE